jgi:hypothetical protein
MRNAVARFMDKPSDYQALQRRAIAASATEFSGTAFAEDFWRSVEGLWSHFSGPRRDEGTAGVAVPALQHCLMKRADLPHIFETVPQPMTRIATGRGRVTELAGAFIYTEGNRNIDQHEWSVLAEYWKPGAPALVFVHDIRELNGEYLTAGASSITASNTLVGFCARLLFPYPRIYHLTSRILKRAQKWLRKTEVKIEPVSVDIELMAQGVSGMNIIRCGHRFYAIPQDGGAFSEERANNGGYRLCIKGGSLKSVLARIADDGRTVESSGQPMPILVEEGFGGFNIIQYADSFFAIPQDEGAFAYERAITNGYSQHHAGMTLEATKLAITGAPK